MTVDQEAHAGMFVRRAIEFTLAVGVFLFGIGVLLFPTAWDHPVYHLLDTIAPQRVWGTAFLSLGLLRSVIVIINGFWPLSPVARLSLSIATLILVWLPLAASNLAYFRMFLLGDGGGFLPGLMLIGIAVMIEGLCMYALTALRGARKHVG